MIKSIDDYLSTLKNPLLNWTLLILDYFKKNYGEYQLTFSYQRPMLKLSKKLFIMLGGGKNHFSIYTTDFLYVNLLKERNIPKLQFGKSAILFPINDLTYIDVAYKICDEVIQRHKESI